MILAALAKARSQDVPGVLTNAAQVKALSVTVAAQRVPVQLQGVVTGEGKTGIVIQDATMGIYLYAGTNDYSWLKRGDLVEVAGVSDPGEFAPVVRPASIHKIGTAPVPTPRPVTFDQLANGFADAQWVEISGIVREVETVGPYQFKLILAAGSARLTVQYFGVTNTVQSLVDSEVRLCGICFYQFNRSRQILSPRLMVPGAAQLTVEKPAPQKPFAAPLREPQSLMLFSLEDIRRHRVRVRGTVLHQLSGTTLWLRDAGHGLRVETRQAQPLQPGDEVEALGFPGSGEFTPILEDAIFQNISAGTNAPQPLRVAEKSAALAHDADLIQLEAELQELTRTVNGWLLTLDWKGASLRATLPETQTLPTDWQPGSRVRVTGICQVATGRPTSAGGLREPQDFQLLLRSAGDLLVLQKPPWWTPQRVVLALGLATGCSLIAAAVVAWFARQRLREQALRRTMAEAEFSAMFAERNRIAREIHDTLAQGLGAISMHLEMVKDQLGREPDKVARHLEIAHQMARQSLTEARESIWNMRSQVLENGDLAEALQGILRQLTDGTATQGEFTASGNVRRLAPVIENNLLRLGQEAVANAVKHAHAKKISVVLMFTDRQVALTVRDDGGGFDSAQPPTGSHFGLRGQRERTAQLGGKLAVQSAPGHGTEVTVQIPIYD